MTQAPATVTPFGASLRRWRKARGASQLELAHRAGTTSRHVSFLETGRSRPSREMVARLATALELPLRECNDLFRAAGLAPAYSETPLAAAGLVTFSGIVDRMLERHDPYPAYAIDRHWNIVRTNRAAERFLPAGEDRNVVRLTYAGPWRDLIANWTEIARPGLHRLEAESVDHPDDDELGRLVALAADACHDLPEKPGLAHESALVMCPHFRVGDDIVRTISVVAHFGAARDVTLDELRIELIHPADAQADAFFRASDGPPSGHS